jgi:hypothetical protein
MFIVSRVEGSKSATVMMAAATSSEDHTARRQAAGVWPSRPAGPVLPRLSTLRRPGLVKKRRFAWELDLPT